MDPLFHQPVEEYPNLKELNVGVFCGNLEENTMAVQQLYEYFGAKFPHLENQIQVHFTLFESLKNEGLITFQTSKNV